MRKDSPAVAAARSELDAAVKKFVSIQAEEEGYPDIYVSAWAGFAEYESRALMEAESTGNMVMIPSDQVASTSRGLFHFGADAFSRVVSR